MSIDKKEMEAVHQEESLLALVKNVTLEGVGKGTLSLTSNGVAFESKGGFFSSPHLEFSVALSNISSAEVEQVTNTLALKWPHENGENVVNELHLPRDDAAVNFCQSLASELELLRRKAEQHERRTYYQAFLWKTAYYVWVMTRLLSQTARNLAQENWDSIDTSLSEMRETVHALAAEGVVDISNPIQTLFNAVPSRDAPLVLRKVIAALKAIGTSLDNALLPAEKWGELALENSNELNWRDIRYFFLFSGRYNLLPLWQQLDDTDNINDSLPRLAKLSSILAEKIPEESQPGILSEDEEASGTTHIADAPAQNLEAILKMKAGIA